MKTILIVDDDSETLKSLEAMLSHLGYQVVAKQDGRSALAVVYAGDTVDLVITDYQMPEMNGLELLSTLKQIAPSVPVIMITGFARVEIYLAALALGAVEYLEKSAMPSELRRIVTEVLHKSTASEAAGQR